VLYASYNKKRGRITMKITMNKKILALSLLLLLTTVFVTSVSVSQVKAVGAGQWITSFKVEDYNTGNLLMNVNSTTGVNATLAPIIPGEAIKVTFNVNVFTSGSGSLRLSTSMQRALQDKYWSLDTSYPLSTDFNPNAQSTTFNWVQGGFTMTVYGIVPTVSTGQPMQFNAVSLYGPTSGIALDQITVPIVTAQMDQFLTLYDQKEAHLRTLISSGVDKGYIDLYTNVLNASQAEANQGYTDAAIALLNGLNVSNEPIASSTQALFLPVIVVLAAVAVVFVILFLRVRGKMSYFQLVVEDQIKDLEGLTIRASKIDRAMSSNLESVKDRLKRLVGM
jgi:hypothetical protein